MARLVLREGMLVVLLGAVIGVALAMAGTRVLGAWLYGISAPDPVTFLAGIGYQVSGVWYQVSGWGCRR